MSYSPGEIYHIGRVEARLGSDAVKAAYARLMTWAEGHPNLFLFPISRGNFSAIHIATRPDARAYADCEFAFKGALNHLRWWFRSPCFETAFCGSDEVLAHFDGSTLQKAGHVTTDLADIGDVDRISQFVDARL